VSSRRAANRRRAIVFIAALAGCALLFELAEIFRLR
jgi:hypothetical protein